MEDSRSFEVAFAAAEGAVEALERGELTLDDSVRRYEDGFKALRRCYEVLRSYEKRIEVLGSELGAVAEGAEEPVWKPASSSSLLRGALEAAGRDEDLPRVREGDEAEGGEGGTGGDGEGDDA